MCAFSRKPWLPKEDQIIIQLVNQNQNKSISQRFTWNEIAQHLILHFPNSMRTGKQCRERYLNSLWFIYRWHNQLDPKIKKYQTWNEDQVNKLFDLQNQYGNKWSKIASELRGRTDNNIKNYFYSSLRRSLRKVNEYITSFRKKKNIKPFQMNVLSKILAISDQKNRVKLNIKADLAINLASEIKMKLIELSKEQEVTVINEQQQNKTETLIRKIQQFNKNCKRRKTKKIEVAEIEMDMEQPSQQVQKLIQEVSNQQKSKNFWETNERNHPILENKKVRQKNAEQAEQKLHNKIVRSEKPEEDKKPSLQLCQNMFLERKLSLSRKSSNRSTDDFFKRSTFEGNYLKNSQYNFFDENPFDFSKQSGNGFCFFGENGPETIKNCKMLESLDLHEFYNRSERNFLEMSLFESSFFKKDSKKVDE